MKYINEEKRKELAEKALHPDETFNFQCHAALACFNKCCRNLNLFLYPYDVLRLSRHLEISTDEFIERYVDVVMRDGHYFPEVLLRMADNEEKTCPYLTEKGCSVYPDRPDTCRTFPVEQGAQYDAAKDTTTAVHFFRPPDFCLGQHEEKRWTADTWADDQEAEKYHEMTLRWAQVRRLFQSDPWGVEGPNGAKAKMAFMATYNLDSFRDFLFSSSFFKRYRIKPDVKKRLRVNDKALLLFGFEWVKFFVWGIPSKKIRNLR